jgi:hypothetical protein
MKVPQGTTPQPAPPGPMPNEDGSGSLPNNNGEQNRERQKSSAFDDLLKLDQAFYKTESRLLARLAARMDVPQAEIDDIVQEVWREASEHRNQFAGLEEEVKRSIHCWLTKAACHKAKVDPIV